MKTVLSSGNSSSGDIGDGETLDNPAMLINASSPDDVLEDTREVSTEENSSPKEEKLNIVYTLFWSYLMTFMAAASFVWADFIPGFGLVAEPALLGKQ